MNKKHKNVILFSGHRGSGKISNFFLRKLKKLGILGTRVMWRRSKELTFESIEKLIHDPMIMKIFIFPLFTEDVGLTNRGFVNHDYPRQIEEFVKEKDVYGKCIIVHSHKNGRLLGNKIETNKFFTKIGIPCPSIVTNINYDKPIFVNDPEGSRSRDAGVKPNAFNLDPTKYNTELIDTSYEYQGKTYYVNPRVMCVGGEISHFIIKCISTEKNDRVVRTPWDVTYDEAPGLQYDFFKTQIVPDYDYLVSMFRKINKKIGFGMYSYDLLKDVKNKKWYVSEAMFKFDSAGSVRRSPYSIITYRQIHKEVYGTNVKKYEELEAMENVPYYRPQDFHIRGILTKEEYTRIMNGVLYWSLKLFRHHFEKVYTSMKKEAKANGTWEEI